MIEFSSTNPQIILLSLAILIGAIAALFFGIAAWRRNAMAWRSFRQITAKRKEEDGTLLDSLEKELARILRTARASHAPPTAERLDLLRVLTEEIGKELKALNPEFDRKHFLRSSGYFV